MTAKSQGVLFLEQASDHEIFSDFQLLTRAAQNDEGSRTGGEEPLALPFCIVPSKASKPIAYFLLHLQGKQLPPINRSICQGLQFNSSHNWIVPNVNFSLAGE